MKLIVIAAVSLCGVSVFAQGAERTSGDLHGKAFVCNEDGYYFRADGRFISHYIQRQSAHLARWTAVRDPRTTEVRVHLHDAYYAELDKMTKVELPELRWTFATAGGSAEVSMNRSGTWLPLGRCTEIGEKSRQSLSAMHDSLHKKIVSLTGERERAEKALGEGSSSKMFAARAAAFKLLSAASTKRHCAAVFRSQERVYEAINTRLENMQVSFARTGTDLKPEAYAHFTYEYEGVGKRLAEFCN